MRSPDALAGEFAGLPAEVVRLDVTDQAAVVAAANACPDVNLLVNNAGLFTNTRLVRPGDRTPPGVRWRSTTSAC